MSDSLRIAFTKQEVYQDLYVCSHDEKSSKEILFSSSGRVGPIGLIHELGADFYILKEEPDRETQAYRKVVPQIKDYVRLLNTETLDKLPGQGFKRPGSRYPNGKFSVSCYDVDWQKYDIVISLNVCIPRKLVKQFGDTLFCYMIGEANLATEKVKFGYDVTLNQMARGLVAEKMGAVDFPYTFVRGDTLEKIMFSALGEKPEKSGIYAEVNTSKERPVREMPPQFEVIGKETNTEIRLHEQLISKNLEAIYRSKYFVKLGGRKIRGNSIVEAISLGTLVLMDPAEVTHDEVLPDRCEVRSAEEIIRIIQRLDSDPAEYRELLNEQRELVNRYMYDAPLESLVNCLRDKRGPKPNFLSRIMGWPTESRRH